MYTTQLAVIKNTMNSTSQPPLETASFDMLSLPNACRIWILQRKNSSPWLSVKDALADIGIELQLGRKSISSLKERAVFGLPLIVRDLDKSKLKEALEGHRRASPLHLKVSRLQGGRYVGIAVLFKTQFKSIDDTLPEPNYSLIEEWIEKKLTRMTALEVIL